MFTRSHGAVHRHILGVLLALSAFAGAVDGVKAQPTSPAWEAAPIMPGVPTSGPTTAGADPYDQLVDGGVAEFASGHWAEARLLFERAHLLRPSARTLRALGMSAFNLHEYARALCELESALAATEQPLDPAMRAQVEQLVLRATPLVGRFTVAQTPASGTLQADGREPVRDGRGRLLLDIGQHTLTLRATGHAPLRHALAVLGGEDAALALRALPLSEPADEAALPVAARPVRRRRLRVLSLAAAGLGVGAGSLVSWLRADSRFDALAEACRARGGCFDDAVDLGHVRRLERTAYGLAGVGASLLLTSIVLGAIELWRDDAPESRP